MLPPATLSVKSLSPTLALEGMSDAHEGRAIGWFGRFRREASYLDNRSSAGGIFGDISALGGGRVLSCSHKPQSVFSTESNVFAFDTKLLDPAPSARRFEGGSPPIPLLYAALPGLELLSGLGMSNVAAQIEKLASRARPRSIALDRWWCCGVTTLVASSPGWRSEIS